MFGDAARKKERKEKKGALRKTELSKDWLFIIYINGEIIV
jgi:hypothetical protein